MQRRRPARPESPIEDQFWTAWQQRAPHILLELQYPACGGTYRLDFAHPPSRIAIELDGFTHHSSHARFTQDRKRHRDLVRDGWRVLVFSGSEVFHQPERCVDEARATIEQLSGMLAPPVLPLAPTTRRQQSYRRGLVSSVLLGLVVLCLAVGYARQRLQLTVVGSGTPPGSPSSIVPTRAWIVAPTATLSFDPPRPNTVSDVEQIPTLAVLRTAVVQSPELNVRNQPALDALVLGRIKQGVVVEVLEDRGIDGTRWSLIRVTEDELLVEGWVNAGFLR